MVQKLCVLFFGLIQYFVFICNLGKSSSAACPGQGDQPSQAYTLTGDGVRDDCRLLRSVSVNQLKTYPFPKLSLYFNIQNT